MFSVRIRRHIMIAHSLPDPVFGPAANLHGATYVVDAEFFRAELNEHNIVIDIGLATDILGRVLEPLAYQNLDEMPTFQDTLTTTEFLCQYVHEQICHELAGDFAGELRVTLGESHVAWASYQAVVA